MTNPFLNRVFYGIDKQKVNADFIKNLNVHVLTKSKKENALKFIDSSIKKDTRPSTEMVQSTPVSLHPTPVIDPVIQPPLLSKKTIYPTSATNTIFWSVYIAVYGLADYQLLGTAKERKRELEEKQKMLDFFEKNPQILKRGGGYKLTNVEVTEYKSDLLLEKDGLRSLVGYSSFYKTNIVVIFKEQNAYLRFTHTDETMVSDEADDSPAIPTIVLEYSPKTRTYGLNVEFETDSDLLRVRPWNNCEKLEEFLQTMFEMEHYEKPLKAIGNYKVANLEDIAKLLAIDVSSMKKQDMYQAIYGHISVVS